MGSLLGHAIDEDVLEAWDDVRHEYLGPGPAPAALIPLAPLSLHNTL